jgi:hypothetical protein
MGRRRALRGLLAAIGVAAGTATVGVKIMSRTETETKAESAEDEVGDSIEGVEDTIEQFPESPRFAGEVEGYRAFVTLGKDEVLFVDEHNKPVGGPQKFKDFTVYRSATSRTPKNQIRPDGTVAYKLGPGANMNAIGIPQGGVAPEWTNYVEANLEHEYPDRVIARRMNVINDFMAALSEKDEPELVSAIKRGEIESYDDIVGHFAEKPVRGHEDHNRMQYVREKVRFRTEPDERRKRPALPLVLQEEMRRLLPGLIAQESKFNGGLVSDAKDPAVGIAQIKFGTWKEYRPDDEQVSLRMDDQIDVAGQLISDNYHYITHFAGDTVLQKLQAQFSSEEAFLTEFMTPLMINAYNVGGPGIGKILKQFGESVPEGELAEGKDLFIQFADFAQTSDEGDAGTYKEDAREYTTRVYANAQMLEERYADISGQVLLAEK